MAKIANFNMDEFNKVHLDIVDKNLVDQTSLRFFEFIRNIEGL